MDENALKRKRELEGEEISEPESSDLDMDITKEKPLEGIKSKAKKQKTQHVKRSISILKIIRHICS